MKPYGQIKKTMYFNGKNDIHVHGRMKRQGYVNWWEERDNIVPRTSLKNFINKEIEYELLNIYIDNYYNTHEQGEF